MLRLFQISGIWFVICLTACSAQDEDRSSSKDGDLMAIGDAVHQSDSDKTEDDELAAPPEEVSGSFLTLECDRTGLMNSDEDVEFGCGAYENGQKLENVSDFQVEVTLREETVTPDLTEASPQSRWHVLFYLTAEQDKQVKSFKLNATVNGEPKSDTSFAIDSRHYVFVTENEVSPGVDFVGLAGADAYCQSEGVAFDKKIGRQTTTWKAILQSRSESVKSRVNIAGPVFNTNSTPELVAINSDQFWLENDADDHETEIQYTVNSADVNNEDVWTGAIVSGLEAALGGEGGIITNFDADIKFTLQSTTIYDCNEWTSDQFGDSGSIGDTEDRDEEWISDGTSRCNGSARLYCISQ